MSFISHSENRVAAKLTVAVAVGLTELVFFFGEKDEKESWAGGRSEEEELDEGGGRGGEIGPHKSHEELSAGKGRPTATVCLSD